MSRARGADPRRGSAPAVAVVGVATLFTTATVLVCGAEPRLPVVGAGRPIIRTMSAASYAEGAPAGFSGGFTEQSCHGCHFHAEANTGPGRVTIEGVPQRFVAGREYPLTITLMRPGMAIGGFQLTARFKDGGAQAGTLVAATGEQERIGVEAQADVQYAGQRRQGTALVTRDSARWALIWTAPTNRRGLVLFHVAANAADADGSVNGDYVHTAVVESAPSSDQPVVGTGHS